MLHYEDVDARLDQLRFVEKQVPGYTYNDCLVSLLNLPDTSTHLRVNRFIKEVRVDEVYGDGDDAPSLFNTLFIPLTRDVDIIFALHAVTRYGGVAAAAAAAAATAATATDLPITRIELYVGTLQKVQEIRLGATLTLPLFAARLTNLCLRVQYAGNLHPAEFEGVRLDLDVGFIQTRARKALFRGPHHGPKWTVVSGRLNCAQNVAHTKHVLTRVKSRQPYHWLPPGRVKILPGSGAVRVCDHRNNDVVTDSDGWYSGGVWDDDGFNFATLKVVHKHGHDSRDRDRDLTVVYLVQDLDLDLDLGGENPRTLR